MKQQLEQMRGQHHESWSNFSPGWKRWDDLFMDFLKPAGDEIIRLLHPRGDQLVLDVASGTGEPGLTIAEQMPGGKVIVTDLAEAMLEIADENAMLRGITNIQTLACDVHDLPFADNTFDAISCGFGFMFFPDMELAAREMVRVLKPGGKIATSVWNVPEKNFWISAALGAIARNLAPPPPTPDAPGMFRCAGQGFIAGLFRDAGLKNIAVSEVNGTLNCKTATAYWEVITEMAAPVSAALSKTNDAMREKIKRDVQLLVNEKYGVGNIRAESSALVIGGEK